MEVEFQVLEKSEFNSETNAVLSTFDLSFVSVRLNSNKEEEYKCVECGMSFVTTRLLFQNHLLMHQNGQIPKKKTTTTRKKYTKKNTVKPGPAAVVSTGGSSMPPRKETRRAAIGKENNLLLKKMESNEAGGGDILDVEDGNTTKVKGESSAVVPSTHTGNNANKCERCGIEFNSVGALNAHECECECETCGKVFANTNQLNGHKRSHMERNFICKFCGKAFKRSSHLKGHFATHKQVDEEIHAILIEEAIKEAKIKNGGKSHTTPYQEGKGKTINNGKKKKKGRDNSNGTEEKGGDNSNDKVEKGKTDREESKHIDDNEEIMEAEQ